MSEYRTREQKNSFYKSREWRGKSGLRERVLERDNYECAMCRAEGKVTTHADATLEVDHIKEIEFYPELAKDEENLQVLCRRHHNQKHNRFAGTVREDVWKDEKW